MSEDYYSTGIPQRNEVKEALFPDFPDLHDIQITILNPGILYVSVPASVASWPQGSFEVAFCQRLENHPLTKKGKPWHLILRAEALDILHAKSKRKLLKCCQNLMRNHGLKQLAFIQAGRNLRTWSRIFRILNPGFHFSNHPDQNAALNHLEKLQHAPEQGGSNGYQVALDQLPEESGIFLFRGKRLKWETKPEWLLEEDEKGYFLQAFLINGNIAFFKNGGNMTGSHADREAIIYREMLEISGLPALFLVYDAIAVSGFSFSARRQLVKIDKELRPHRIWYFSCLPGLLRTLFSVYKALVPAAAHNMSFFPNWGEALAACLDGNMIPYSKENMEPGFLPDQELKVLKSLSRTEMETLALELIRSNHEAQEARRRESQILFDAISRIAWDENLPPVRVPDNYEGDDEFIKVITALSVLQKDLVEMTRELVELNQNLEEKVVARTREISAKEANLVALVENTDDMILSVDKDLRILVINRAYQDYLNRNFKVELKQGDHLLEGTPETRALFWLPSFKKALKGEKVQLLTSRTFSGEDYSLQISMNPIREPSGEVDGVCVYIRDVSEFKLAETKVREHEQMLNTISENINEGIFRVSANDRFLFVNRAFARLFGYENPENLIGQRTADLYVSNQRRLEILEMIRKDGAFANEEVEFVCRDGRTFWGLLNGVISIDSKERFYLDAAIRDITEQRSVEKVLKEQNEALLKVNSELDSFVYSTSHDLRAPLVSLSGLIHILREEKDVDQQKRYLGLMDESIRKMEEFIIDILTYSRNTRQEVEVRKIQFDQLISQVFDGLKFMKSYKTIRINTVIDQAIPFYSDPRRMASLLRNLISNALRYYDPEKEAPFVEVEVNVGKEKARIEVRDNGIGIAKEYQDKIFGMFFRASSMSKGSGLGLYIVKETLEKLGGTVSVDSELGKGTTIRIEVPARQVS